MKKIEQKYPMVALVGRTNVGKSTIFNRLVGKRHALVSDKAGTTRDSREAECTWIGRTFLLADTAGLDVDTEKLIDIESVKKAEKTIKNAAMVLFVVSVQDTLLPQDQEIALKLKKLHKNVVVVVNKVDKQKYVPDINDFYSLGFNDIIGTSAKTGSGLGDVLDAVINQLKLEPGAEDTATTKDIKIAIIGKPNVGKSSLFNKIIGEDKVIISPLEHTTRESQDVTITYTDEVTNKEYLFTFIDTAGIIKKRKIADRLQKQSIEQSLDSLSKSELALLVIDAGSTITMQDKNLAKEILENDKSVIFVINKWDLLEGKTTKSDNEYIKNLHRDFPYLTWAPVVFTSALTGSRIDRLLREIVQIHENQFKEIPETELYEFLKSIIKKQSPRKTKGIKPPYLHNMKQIRKDPLTFLITADQAENIHFSYTRFIKNQLREKFNFWGCGIKIIYVERRRKKSHQT